MDKYSNCGCCCNPCCGNCSNCTCSGAYDIDLTVEKSDLSCHPCCTSEFSYAGSKTIKACMGVNDTACPTTDAATLVNTRVTNNTDHCIWVQFFFDISGLTDSDCTMNDNVCGNPLNGPGRGNGTHQAWFFYCVGPHGSASLCFGHRVVGPCKCCPQVATISNYKYFICCQDNTPPETPDCPVVSFCAPFLTSCPECCDCCCVTDDTGPQCCNNAVIFISPSNYSCVPSPSGPCPTFECLAVTFLPSTMTAMCGNTYPNCTNESVCTYTRNDAGVDCSACEFGMCPTPAGQGMWIGGGDSCPHEISCPG